MIIYLHISSEISCVVMSGDKSTYMYIKHILQSTQIMSTITGQQT